MLKRARVVSSGRVTIPNTDDTSALQVITDYEWAVAGERGPETGIYLAPPYPDPRPATGEPIAWEGKLVTFRGQAYRRLGYEFDPSKPLH